MNFLAISMSYSTYQRALFTKVGLNVVNTGAVTHESRLIVFCAVRVDLLAVESPTVRVDEDDVVVCASSTQSVYV